MLANLSFDAEKNVFRFYCFEKCLSARGGAQAKGITQHERLRACS